MSGFGTKNQKADMMAAAGKTGESGVNFGKWALVVAALVAVIAVGVGVARNAGLFEAKPEAAAPAATANTPDEAIAQLEAKLKADPGDVEGWQMLGWAFFSTGRYPEAATAYRRATNLAPDNAVMWSSLGEAIVYTAKERVMPPDASAAFKRALALDPEDPRARFWSAAELDLKGDGKGAIDGWLALLADTPSGAPWEQSTRETIAQVGEKYGIDVADRLAAIKPAPPAPGAPSMAAAGIPGPNAADMAAAAKLPPGQQEAMVAGMVNGLEAKLAANPANPSGWIMLMRSRMTLGEERKAATAYRSAMASNPTARADLTAAAKELGIPGT